jgi:Na+-driven multidrug efflux pump
MRWPTCPDLSIIYGQVGQRISLCLSTILSIVFFTCAHPLIRMFTDDPMIIQNGAPLLYITAIITFAQLPQVVYSGALRGAGNSRAPMIIMLVSFVGFRQLYLFVVANFISNTVLPIAMGYPAGWLLCSALTYFYYKNVRLAKSRLVEDQET